MSSTSSTRPRFSVVIVTYNSRENIQVCLDSLRRCSGGKGNSFSGDHEIIVVDNNSRDGTPDYLSGQERAGSIQALLNKDNYGFSQACNQGAAKAKGEFLIFLNPDTLVSPGWSGAMARYFEDPGVGAAGPLSNYVAGLQRLDLHLPSPYKEGASIPGEDAVGKTANLARILKEANEGRGVTTKLLIGFCLMIRRTLFAEMGGMDEKLFLGNDDLDLSLRLRNRGLKLVVATDAFVFHEGQKSFKTEAKTHVDRLVQESTDALYLKLVDLFGGREKVPSPEELWGIGWFAPSPSLLRGGDLPSRKGELSMITETRQLTAWKGVTALIYLGPDQGSNAEYLARLDRTLTTLPNHPADVMVLNCSSWSGPIARQPDGGFRRLDLGASCSPKAALELASALAQDHILFCAAGVGFTALFNHWLEKRLDKLPTGALPLPIRAEGDSDADPEAREKFPGCAFLCRKAWLRDALGAIVPTAGKALSVSDASAFLGALGERISASASAPASAASAAPAADKPADPPWLLARPADLPGNKATDSWTPVKALASDPAPDFPAFSATSAALAPKASSVGKWDQAIENYPKTLGPAMRDAKDIAFAGTVAEALPVKGSFHVFDMNGDRVPFKDQDLVILRLTPDLVEGLVDRLRNLRRQGSSLKRLMVVLNDKQALKKPRPEGSLLAAIDVTPDGARAALWQAGFAVTAEKPYSGLPPVAGAGSDLAGWTLLEAAPRKADHRIGKKVSIVILGFNQVEYTKKCIESIRKHTRQSYELILVDNGSKDGTEAFFRSIPGAKVIRNAENQGVSKGWNQGMRLAEGDYLLIFNNDTIVGPGWLENMVRLCESDPAIGMVGPRSNYIAGPQIVAPVPYKTEEGIQDFIRKWQADHDLAADEFAFIKGFCLLIPRPVFDKVGFFDERYGKGNFEDDDYCMRVRYHGYRALIAHDSFIHHYGSVSFNQESVDWKALMVENQQKYVKKWSRGAAALYDTVVSQIGPALSAAPPAPAIRVPPPAPAIRVPPPVSAGSPMPPGIEEARAAYAAGNIEQARALFLDAQVRRPDHPEAYCGLGVLAFHDGQHMDAGSLFLRCLELDPAHEDAAGNLMDVLAALEGGLPSGDLQALASRFPGNAAFRAALAEAGEAGSAATAAEADPSNRPLAPWRAEVEDLISRRDWTAAIDKLENRLKTGGDNAACFNYMGVISHACGDQAFAAENFRNALKPEHGPADPDAIYNLADTLVSTGRAGEALSLLENPPAMDPAAAADAEMSASAEQVRHAIAAGRPDAARLVASRDANMAAEKLLRAGDPARAKALLADVLREDAGDFRALNNMGLAEWDLGHADEAWRRFRASLAISPAWTDALVNGFDAALAAGLMEEFPPVAQKALTVRPGHPEAWRMLEFIDREGLAIHDVKTFHALEKEGLLMAKAERAMQEGRQGEAISAYLEAIEGRPRNPQALNGLGIIAFSAKKHVDAYALFEAAAALNPMDQDILVNLWQAAHELRREQDVLPRLKTSLERNPAMHDIKAILENA